ncbi:hypothetical protein GGR50DRAFT_696996 [Xylaria sp. CBS 124048]|nr:hypothetical protein GGR50DRAFT_696996 [Xylaria sp. CBS 124048]
MSLITEIIEESNSGMQNDWVKVSRRKGRRVGKATLTSAHFASALEPTPSIPSLSLEQVKQAHSQIAMHWKVSAACVRLRGLLSGCESTGDCGITRAICFGLGSFDPPDGVWEQRRKAHIQLAAFLTLVEHFQGNASRRIRCIFQDPIFNSVDKAFIASLGHEVVESPIGFQLVGVETLVFGIHLYRDIYSQVIATHIPAVFVGTPYEVWEDAHGAENLDWERMKNLDQLCAKVKFPENHTDTTFSSTTIHWRRKD